MRKTLDIVIGLALWFALGGFLGGCGDAPGGSGTSRCNNLCKGNEQCVPVLVTATGPQCGVFPTCKVPGNACIDPAKMTPLQADEEEQQQ